MDRYPMGKMISTKEAAEMMGVKPPTLRDWRCQKKGPSFFRYSPSLVVYDEEDIKRFMAGHRVPLANADDDAAPGRTARQ
jgi:hypothetical protein